MANDSIHQKDTVLNVNVLNAEPHSTFEQYRRKVNKHFKKKGIQMAYRRGQVLAPLVIRETNLY